LFRSTSQRRSRGPTPAASSVRRTVSTPVRAPVSTSAGCGPSIRKPAVSWSQPPSMVSSWRIPGAISSIARAGYPLVRGARARARRRRGDGVEGGQLVEVVLHQRLLLPVGDVVAALQRRLRQLLVLVQVDEELVDLRRHPARRRGRRRRAG